MTAPDIAGEVIMLAADGIPAPQGSKTRMPNGAMLEGKTPGQRRKHKSWRLAVEDAARDAVAKYRLPGPLTGALAVDIDFRFPLPKSRPAWQRLAGWVWRTIPPDVDKCERSTLDALKDGGLIADDALVADLHSTTRDVVGWTGALIRVHEILADWVGRSDPHETHP